MIIEVNKSRSFEINEDFLVVKDDTLYNKKLKKREGIDGDIVSFSALRNSRMTSFRGMVDGYTCGNRVKLRGVDEVFENASDVRFEFISVVTKTDCLSFEEKELLAAES